MPELFWKATDLEHVSLKEFTEYTSNVNLLYTFRVIGVHFSSDCDTINVDISWGKKQFKTDLIKG